MLDLMLPGVAPLRLEGSDFNVMFAKSPKFIFSTSVLHFRQSLKWAASAWTRYVAFRWGLAFSGLRRRCL